MDDLLDLNWSTTSPLGSSESVSRAQKPPSSNDAFDFLNIPSSKPSVSPSLTRTANTGSSTPNYYNTPPLRSTTPNTAPLPSSSTLPTPRPPGPGPSSYSPNTDAFSSLLSLGSSPASTSKHVSIAEKQRILEEEKRKALEHERAQFDHGAFWDKHGIGTASKAASNGSNGIKGYGNLLAPTSGHGAKSTPTIPKPPTPSLGVIAPSPAKPTKAAGSIWDNPAFFDGKTSQPQSGSSRSTPAPTSTSPAPPPDIFDFDALDSLSISRTQSTSRNGDTKPGTSGMRTPVSDFDSGEKEEHVDEDDDFLAEMNGSARPNTQVQKSISRNGSTFKQRSSSPPPHILGQIVEMGFSPAQARSALSQTSTGLDVQAALELLLTQSGFKSAGTDPTEPMSEEDDDRVERERRRREEERRERHRARRQGPSRDSVRPQSQAEREHDNDARSSTPLEYEKYLAQASEIGQLVLSKASSFWNVGKEKALKVYEEQRKAIEAQNAAGGSKGKIRDGRPRWMIEAEAEKERNGWADDSPTKSDHGGFKDEDSPPRSKNQRIHQPERPREMADPQPRARKDDERYVSVRERADLLFAEEPQAYKSPARYRKPTSNPTPSAPTPRVSTPAPARIIRTLVQASQAQITSAASYKGKGNEHFKLGRFSEAENAYSSAISALPEGHLLLIPLWNNRAATRLKMGSAGGVVSDSSSVIDMIGLSYHPSKENTLPAEYSEVKLGEALVKALLKRAQAWEMDEKYKTALEDYERLISLDTAVFGSSAVSTRSLASEGARRARKMLDPKPAPVQSTKPAPVTKPKVSAPARVIPDSTAVLELRKAAAAQESEDAQKLALKDKVDAKLEAWKAKGGQDKNLRALIASLDMVLWDSILSGGLKVGMHELITEKQVKIKYIKVIARLHPDKLDVNKTTVEQRMLANGAFGLLNEAWQEFQK